MTATVNYEIEEIARLLRVSSFQFGAPFNPIASGVEIRREFR